MVDNYTYVIYIVISHIHIYCLLVRVVRGNKLVHKIYYTNNKNYLIKGHKSQNLYLPIRLVSFINFSKFFVLHDVGKQEYHVSKISILLYA